MRLIHAIATIPLSCRCDAMYSGFWGSKPRFRFAFDSTPHLSFRHTEIIKMNLGEKNRLMSKARREWLRNTAWAASAAALGGVTFGLPGACASADENLKPLKLSWNAGAICTAPVPVAEKQGFFRK